MRKIAVSVLLLFAACDDGAGSPGGVIEDYCEFNAGCQPGLIDVDECIDRGHGDTPAECIEAIEAEKACIVDAGECSNITGPDAPCRDLSDARVACVEQHG